MKDVTPLFDYDLSDLDGQEWLDCLDDISDEFGHFEPIGADHSAVFIDAGRSLIVTFESTAMAQGQNPGGAPLGWSMVKSHGWSSLSLIAHNDLDWFRGPAIFGYFDRMIDDGFFDDFDQVLFFGAGPSGYAAAAYSIASPEAQVLLVQPQATLCRGLAGWDRRFPQARRQDFTSRFGYAPRMVETASNAWVIHDPMIVEDAVHASLFDGDNTQHFKTPRLGDYAASEFIQMGILPDLLSAAMQGSLESSTFGKLWRARRNNMHYARTTLRNLDSDGRHPRLLARFCRAICEEDNRPQFARKLAELEARGIVL